MKSEKTVSEFFDLLLVLFTWAGTYESALTPNNKALLLNLILDLCNDFDDHED
jgi:hypothetical protein